MIVRLLTEHHLECLSLKEGGTGSSESTLVKMSHYWKSHVTAQLLSFYAAENHDQLSSYLIKSYTVSHSAKLEC